MKWASDPPPVGAGRFAWRSFSKIAIDTDHVVDAAVALADLLPALLAAVDTPDAAATPPAARVAAASELAATAARLRHVAMRLQVAATTLIVGEDVHLADAERTPRTWLARHSGLTHHAASELCRVADTCARFPAVGAAFHAGNLTAGHVDAIARIIPARFTGAALEDAIDKVRDVQDVLVGAARDATVTEFAELCARVRARLDTDGPTDPAAESSKVWLHQLFNGRWSLSGDLSPDDGARLATFLAERRARRHGARTTTNPETTENAENTENTENVENVDPQTFAEEQALDLLDLVGSGAADGRPGRVGLFLHIDLDELNAPAHGGDDGLDELLAGRRPAHTEAGLDITDDTLWGLLADADVTPVFERTGRSLSYGRTRPSSPTCCAASSPTATDAAGSPVATVHPSGTTATTSCTGTTTATPTRPTAAVSAATTTTATTTEASTSPATPTTTSPAYAPTAPHSTSNPTTSAHQPHLQTSHPATNR